MWPRTLAPLLVLAALAPASGCVVTDGLWHGGWPVARSWQQRIDTALIDADARVWVRLVGEDGAHIVWSAEIPCHDAPRDPRVAFVEASRQDDEARLPPAAVVLEIVDPEAIDLPTAPANAMALRTTTFAGARTQELRLRRDGAPHPIDVHLPAAPIDWTSANAIGHVALTPLDVGADAALLPLWVLGGLASLAQSAVAAGE